MRCSGSCQNVFILFKHTFIKNFITIIKVINKYPMEEVHADNMPFYLDICFPLILAISTTCLACKQESEMNIQLTLGSKMPVAFLCWVCMLLAGQKTA